MNIDKRKKYYMVLDTETANTIVEEDGKLNMRFVLPYDIGYQVIDKSGNIYIKRSFVVDEIFNHEKDLMTSAYYANKIPQYLSDIASGNRIVASVYQIRKTILEDMETYNTNIVMAHNARFDYTALNNVERWVTKSAYRYFFPYGTEWWDTLKMAHDTICQQKAYKRFCEENGYMTKHRTPRPRETAEVLYRYISCDNEFIEKHTGLEDVEIESQIFTKCMAQHKAMRKKLWED